MNRRNKGDHGENKTSILSTSFFERRTQEVARDLLGTLLVKNLNGELLIGRIVEAEAYDGPHDLACHASKGKTKRTSVMFGPAGRTYIYFTYGMHWCLNFVTGPVEYPAAVLIRAIEPIEGLATMSRLRNTWDLNILTNGPSRLCQALALDKRLNAQPLGRHLGLWVKRGDSPVPRRFIHASPRIGVDYAGAYRLKPWRYFIKGNPFVSRP